MLHGSADPLRALLIAAGYPNGNDIAKNRLGTTWNALTQENIGEVHAHERQQPSHIAAMTVAATVFEIIVTQPKSRGVFGFAKLPARGDRLYLRSPKRGVSRYAVTDVALGAGPEESGAGSDAEPVLASVHVAFLEEIW